jgi:hypothetical protein
MSDSFLGEIEEKLRLLFLEADRVRAAAPEGARRCETTKDRLKRQGVLCALQRQISALQKFQQFKTGDWVKRCEQLPERIGQVTELMLNGVAQVWVKWMAEGELSAVPVPEQPELLEKCDGCRSCGAPLIWGETAAGKKCPFNPDGTSHFATCPDARSWSRKAKQPNGQLELSFDDGESCSNSNTANSLGESEDSAERLGNGTQSASSQPPTATSTKTRSQFTPPTSQTCSSTATSETTSPTGENLTSSPAASPVPEPATQAIARASNIQSQNFGETDCESWQPSAPATSSGSNPWELSIEVLEQSLADAEWQAIVGSLSRWQPQSLAQRTDEIDYLSLPTLTTGTGKYRNSGRTKCEQRLKELGAIKAGYQLSPEGMAALMGFPLDWFAEIVGNRYPLGATASQMVSEKETTRDDSQPKPSPPPKPRSRSKESCTCPSCDSPLLNLEDGYGTCGWMPQAQANIFPKKTLGISFGKTSDRITSKTVTRRDWKPSRARTFTNYYLKGLTVPALDKGRQFGGKEIGTLRLTEAPYTERLADMPDSDVIAEGFPELTKQQFIDRFFDGDSDRVVWVVRFHFIPKDLSISTAWGEFYWSENCQIWASKDHKERIDWENLEVLVLARSLSQRLVIPYGKIPLNSDGSRPSVPAGIEAEFSQPFWIDGGSNIFPKKEAQQACCYAVPDESAPTPQPNILPSKVQGDEKLGARAQPNISPKKRGKKRGRKKGSRNKRPASGSLNPTTQTKKGKTYPVVTGERVPKDLAFDYPEQFCWLYNWAVQDSDGCWKNRSKRVPVGRVYSVRSAIKADKPVEEVLQIIDSNS